MRTRRALVVLALFGAPVTLAAHSAAETPPPQTSRILLRPSQGDGVAAVDADGTDRRVLVESGGQADQNADGSKLVFVRDGVLHIADGDGSNQRRLGEGTVRGEAPRWSPDSSQIAFSADSQVFVIDADGTDRTAIGAGRFPDWSPDATRVVYWAGDRLWIASVGIHAGAIVQLTGPLDAFGQPVAARWSPDGTTIGFGGRCINVIHPDGSGHRCIESFGMSNEFAGWGPDSRSFVGWWTGFHNWGSARWTDPATGERHVAEGDFATDWSGPSGPVPCGSGYWLLGGDGGVFTFGSAAFHGSTGGMRLNRPVVEMAATPTGNGYWLVASDGGIFTFGDATFHGSTGALRLKAPVVGMASTPSGKGYWLVASDGGIFTFGDATFHGSTGALRLKAPVVGMAPTPTGNGYWLVASDGGIFTFGDATFHGSTGSLELASPIVGMAPTRTGGGYLLAGGDGGVFTFGDAEFPGSATDPGLAATVATAEGVGDGLLLATTTGEVVALGDARFCGSTRGLRLAAPIVGAAVID